jgi:hypothetical protein
MCPSKRKSAKRRPVMQAASAIHQHRRQINTTKMKKNKMWFKFYSMEAVINRDWKKPNYDLRYCDM